MTDRQDIWHRLQDHEVSPPQEVFEHLRQTLEGGDGMPGAADLSGVSDLSGAFEKLQQHEVAPPPFLRSEIEQRAAGLTAGVDGGVGRSEVSREAGRSDGAGMSGLSGPSRWYLAAAACLALVAAGWLIYKGGARDVSRGAVTDKRENALPATRGSASADTLAGKKDTSGSLAGAVAADTAVLAEQHGSTRPAFSIEGQAISVRDNDLMATFTGFTYPDIPAYLTRPTDRPLKIYIDQYSHLYVSQPMLSMMKETYLVLPNGKPARKARKMKRRLESWKERDQKRFDKAANGANPLDPLDLAEFIFR